MGTVSPYETSNGRRYRVRYRTPDRRQTDKRGFRTKREAEGFLAVVEVSKLRGEWVDPSKSKISVGEWAEVWFEAQIQIKPTTLSSYRNNLDVHVIPRWGTTRLTDVTHQAVQAWISNLSAKRRPSTVRQVHLCLSGVMKYAVRDGRLPRNPCEDINLPRLEKQERGYLTHTQVQQLAAACGEYGDVIILLSYTGLRWGEMAALKVRSVDRIRHRLLVSEAVTEPRGKVTWGSPKNHERRSVPYPPELFEEIFDYRSQYKHGTDLLFMGPDAGVLRNTNFRHRVFNPAITRIREGDPGNGIEPDHAFPHITPHALRHTAASLAISAGANVKSVQRMLGHASAAMTLDVYADLFEDDLDDVATALNVQANAELVGKMWARPESRT